jgi:hypothetical protein
VRGSRGETQSDLAQPRPSRKSSLPLKQERPYHKPTLVGRDKCPKVHLFTSQSEVAYALGRDADLAGSSASCCKQVL